MIKRFAAGLFAAALVVLLSPSIALAQATSSISGTVVDSAGGAIPGVAVVVTSEGGQTFETVTNAEGIFNIPSIAPGAYKVAVSLAGFKTAVTDVRAAPGTPSTVKMTLEVGRHHRNGERAQQLGIDQHADGHRRVDAQLRPAQSHADADAQRAERRHVPARHQHVTTNREARRSTDCRNRWSRSRWTASATTTTSCARPTRSSRR